MQQVSEQVRLAIGIFDTPVDWWRTVLTLIDAGVATNQLCLVAAEKTVSELEAHDGEAIIGPTLRQQVSSLYAHTERWPEARAYHPIVATSGPLLTSLLRPDGASAQRDSRASGAPTALQKISAEHLSEMEEQVATGAAALIVKSLTPAQQRLSTRALLDQSTHSVKTYDFVLPTA